MYPNVRPDRIRCLEKWGLIRSVAAPGAESEYGFSDLAVIRQASADLACGASFRAVLRQLQAAHDGQRALDFDEGGRSAQLVPLAPPAAQPAAPVAADPSLAEAAVAQAVALDHEEPADQEGAASLYRSALEADPACVPALVNLANIHHARGHLAEAEALYERAIRIAPWSFEAHFNLGNLHFDLERLQTARDCYERALHVNAASADGHFYLAVTLEKLGRPAEARPHWRMYQQLEPHGEWVSLAKEFSE